MRQWGKGFQQSDQRSAGLGGVSAGLLCRLGGIGGERWAWWEVESQGWEKTGDIGHLPFEIPARATPDSVVSGEVQRSS